MEMHVTAELQHKIRTATHDFAGLSSFASNCVLLAEDDRYNYDKETLILALDYISAKARFYSAVMGNDSPEDISKLRERVRAAIDAWTSNREAV